MSRKRRTTSFQRAKPSPNPRLKALARDLQNRQEIARSFKTAQEQQRHLLPAAPDMPGYEFGSYYRPATAIGGDFYDYVKVSADEVGLVIADVTGHGVSAAIIMGMAMKTINIFGRGRISPSEVMNIANQELYQDLDDLTFVSAAYGILNVTNHQIRFVRAGHNFPIVCRPDKEDDMIEVIQPGGMVLGMNTNRHFSATLEEIEFSLGKGDIFLQYTDGLSERMNPQGEEFGDDRILEIVRNYRRAKLDVIIAEIVRQNDEFAGKREQEDDLTLLAVRRAE